MFAVVLKSQIMVGLATSSLALHGPHAGSSHVIDFSISAPSISLYAAVLAHTDSRTASHIVYSFSDRIQNGSLSSANSVYALPRFVPSHTCTFAANRSGSRTAVCSSVPIRIAGVVSLPGPVIVACILSIDTTPALIAVALIALICL